VLGRQIRADEYGERQGYKQRRDRQLFSQSVEPQRTIATPSLLYFDDNEVPKSCYARKDQTNGRNQADHKHCATSSGRSEQPVRYAKYYVPYGSDREVDLIYEIADQIGIRMNDFWKRIDDHNGDNLHSWNGPSQQFIHGIDEPFTHKLILSSRIRRRHGRTFCRK